jgi:hypothetical protein
MRKYSRSAGSCREAGMLRGVDAVSSIPRRRRATALVRSTRTHRCGGRRFSPHQCFRRTQCAASDSAPLRTRCATVQGAGHRDREVRRCVAPNSPCRHPLPQESAERRRSNEVASVRKALSAGGSKKELIDSTAPSLITPRFSTDTAASAAAAAEINARACGSSDSATEVRAASLPRRRSITGVPTSRSSESSVSATCCAGPPRQAEH